METRALGSLRVSVVGVGCNNFGARLDQAGATDVVLGAVEAGVTFFDTADTYGATASEEMLGAALGTRRDEVVIATKFGMPIDDTHFGASPAYVRAACEDSPAPARHRPHRPLPAPLPRRHRADRRHAGRASRTRGGRQGPRDRLLEPHRRPTRPRRRRPPVTARRSCQRAEPVLPVGTRTGTRRRARGLRGTRPRILAVLPARERAPHRQGTPGPAGPRGVAAGQDAGRTQRALVGRRADVQGRRPARLRRGDRRTDAVTRLFVAARVATSSRASSPGPPTPIRCEPTRWPCGRFPATSSRDWTN